MVRRAFIIHFLGLSFFFKISKAKNIFNHYKNCTNLYPEEEILGLVEPPLCGAQFCMRNEALEAYNEMNYEAQKSGIKIWCTSGYRDFNYQKNIWNAKFRTLLKTGLKPKEALQEVLKYSSLPGTSRHHWGTDIDIVDAYAYQIKDPLSEPNFKPEGEYQYLKYWLNNNASRFGFFEVYSNDPLRTGFKYEPWHYSYLPVSKPILKQLLTIDFSTIEELNQCKGFEYFDHSFYEKYKQEYLLGINKILLD